MNPKFFKSAAGFRRWLAGHHDAAGELLVGFYKRESGRGGITYPEALDEALAYGWIDGVRKAIDAAAYSIRFSPRTRGSVWSVVNTRRVRALVKAGRMEAPGLRAFRERDAAKTRRDSYEREHATLDARSVRAFRADRKAWAFFDAQPPGYKRVAVFWVMSAKREETRVRRLAQLIERCRAGMRLDLLTPG
jgi:uncharacterized protein YdeI (YjbR/CyaY-like superfamily)